jgi:hypothetical protein
MCLTPTGDIIEVTDPLEKNSDWQGGYYIATQDGGDSR